MHSILYPHVSIIGSAYLFITLLLGLQLTFNAFRLRPATIVSRVAGVAMLMDCAATISRIIANNCGFAGEGWFVLLSNIWDLLITIALLGIGEVLHSGRVLPKRMTAVALACGAVQVLLSVGLGRLWGYAGTLLCVVVLCGMYIRQTIVIMRHDKQLVDLYSDIEGHRGSWYAMVCIFLVGNTVMWYELHYLNFSDTETTMVYSVVMIVFWIFMVRNVATQVPLNPEVERAVEEDEKEEKEPLQVAEELHSKALLSDEQIRKLQQQMEMLMTEQLLYLDADLNIQTLAERLQSNRRYISYVLNSCMDTNFNEYVNRYRIRRVKHLMMNTSWKLAAIAYESGFNSPGTMSRTFRALEGISPQEFRRGKAS